MGIFDKFLHSKKSVEQEVKSVSESVAPKAKKAEDNYKLLTAPDLPVSFGFKTGWLAIPCEDTQRVLDALGAYNIRRANWKSGVEYSYMAADVFVSPTVDGYTLVVGIDTLLDDIDKLNALAKKLGSLQYFVTHRVVEYHGWAKYVGGELVRAYCYIGESDDVQICEGEPTKEEIRLHMDNYPTNSEDYAGRDFPDESDVLRLAAAWGVDTSFAGGTYLSSIGIVCSISI